MYNYISIVLLISVHIYLYKTDICGTANNWFLDHATSNRSHETDYSYAVSDYNLIYLETEN